MEKFYKNIIGTPVFGEDEHSPLTTVKDLVIDPENGKVIALVVNINRAEIITPVDIISWGDAVKVHDYDVIIHAEDVLRVETVLNSHLGIIDKKVISEDGNVLGKVFDYSIDGAGYALKKLYTAKGFLGLVHYAKRIILAKDIVEILPDKIVVKNDLATVMEEAASVVSDMAQA